jgi:hypothetical protein
VAVFVRRRRRDAAAECIEQLLRDGMIRNADGHGVLAAGDHVVHGWSALRDDGQRAGPECIGELLRLRCHVAHPALQVARMVDVHDDGMRRRPALEAEYLAHRVRVVRVRAQPVNGFGRERDQLAGSQRLDGFLDLFL